MTGAKRWCNFEHRSNRCTPRPDDVERLLSEGVAPTRDDEPVFDAPWQARAFGLAVALARDGTCEWSTFQRSLVDELDDDTLRSIRERSSTSAAARASTESEYYERWVDALVEVLLQSGAVTVNELDERTEAFAAGRRDASEFTVGVDPHGREEERRGV